MAENEIPKLCYNDLTSYDYDGSSQCTLCARAAGEAGGGAATTPARRL